MDMVDVKIPTDNLYKFISISGLLVIFLSILLPDYLVYDVSFKIVDLEKNLNTLEDTANDCIQSFQDKNVDQLTKEQLEECSNAFVLRNDVGATLNKIKILQEISERSIIYMVTGLVFGIIITIVGFALWYTRLQKYLDKIVKQKAGNRFSHPDPPTSNPS